MSITGTTDVELLKRPPKPTLEAICSKRNIAVYLSDACWPVPLHPNPGDTHARTLQ
jgi:hypothetical protein